MCGIAGIFNLNGAPASVVALRSMTDAITHRGPDGEGFFVDGFIGLGHRRLAILDLTPAGHQPMATPDGRFVIAYNGEVYNYLALRPELEARGHQFHSQTDTEVVLHAFAEWGEEALQRLDGMFAFAVWDKQQSRLFLARDRYGVKPLYYTRVGPGLLFGSEIKAILAHGAYQTALDAEALVEYFTFQNFFTDRTLFRDVRILPPGTFMSVQLAQTEEPAPRRYWDYDFRETDDHLSEQDCAEELDRLFLAAVNRQLVSDVEIGAYLSGGIDSGSITAIAARQFPYLKSFTCGFDLHSASGMELACDERESAEYMSYLFKTEHYEMVLKAGDMERVMQPVVHHLEEPRVGQSYPNFYVAQLASKFVKVCLSGSGGDEMFGGYPWRYYRAVVNQHFDEYVDKYFLFWQRLLRRAEIQRVFAPIWNDVAHISSREIFCDVFAANRADLREPEDYVNHSLYFEAKTFLHGLLVMEDKLSMAHGLESRVPFLDNDLVDFAMRLPVRMKLGNLGEVVRLNENDPGSKTRDFFARTNDGKLLLRQVMQRYVPSSITDRVKQGFSAPDASWFKGDSIDYVRRTLFDRKARIYEFMDPETVQALVGEHLEGRTNRRLLIWSLLNFEWWLREFLGD